MQGIGLAVVLVAVVVVSFTARVGLPRRARSGPTASQGAHLVGALLAGVAAPSVALPPRPSAPSSRRQQSAGGIVTGRRGRRRALAVAASLVAAEAGLVGWRRGFLFGAETIVRCRAGHLFTTLWVPGVSLKALRLGWWRLQRCPVGQHWTVVTPVRGDALTPEERRRVAPRPTGRSRFAGS